MMLFASSTPEKLRYNTRLAGSVAERFKALVLKTSDGVTRP
jgi:hypothetical protein